jgi:MFS family permease
VFSLYAFAYPALGSLAGRLTDRWGPRAVITTGGMLLGVAMIGMSFVTRLWEPYLLYGVVAAVGMSAAYVPCNATVVRWFVTRRGLAVGLAMCGSSAGTFAVPLVAQGLVASAGWRTAYVVFGLTIATTLLLVAPLLHRDPESLGLHPDGSVKPTAIASTYPSAWTLGRAMRSGAFWVLAATFTATWIPVFIPLVHLVPFVRDLGYSPMTAAWAVSSLGAGAVGGRLVMGSLSDHFGRLGTLRVAVALQLSACLCFLMAHSLGALLGAAVLYGFGYASVSTLFPPLITDFFGRAHAGAIVGALFAIAGSMGGIGPWLAGALYDATGSYTTTWMLCAALNGAAIVVLTRARPPREHDENFAWHA